MVGNVPVLYIRDNYFWYPKTHGCLSKLFLKMPIECVSLIEPSGTSGHSGRKNDSNRIACTYGFNYYLPIYHPRHFLASDVKRFYHYLNNFHAFRHLRNISFALSCMEVLATHAQISCNCTLMPHFVSDAPHLISLPLESGVKCILNKYDFLQGPGNPK